MALGEGTPLTMMTDFLSAPCQNVRDGGQGLLAQEQVMMLRETDASSLAFRSGRG